MELPDDPQVREAIRAALKRLARREQFSQGLAQDLQVRGHTAEAAAEAIAFLAQSRWLDDRRAAEALLLGRSGRRAVGRRRLREELLAKGAPEPLVSLIMEAIDDEAEALAAEAALDSRRWQKDGRMKAARFLSSRGFEPETFDALLERRFAE